MDEYTEILDYYSALAAQTPGKCVYHAPTTEKKPSDEQLTDPALYVLHFNPFDL